MQVNKSCQLFVVLLAAIIVCCRSKAEETVEPGQITVPSPPTPESDTPNRRPVCNTPLCNLFEARNTEQNRNDKFFGNIMGIPLRFPHLITFPNLLKFFKIDNGRKKGLFNRIEHKISPTVDESQVVLMVAEPESNKSNELRGFLLAAPQRFRETLTKHASDLTNFMNLFPTLPLLPEDGDPNPLFAPLKSLPLWPPNWATGESHLENFVSDETELNDEEQEGSEIDLVSVRPSSDKDRQDQSRKSKSQMKAMPISMMWFRNNPVEEEQRGDGTSETLSQAYEQAVLAELKQLQEIEIEASKMRAQAAAFAKENSDDNSGGSSIYSLNQIPLHQITWKDIETALEDEYMKKALWRATENQLADDHRRNEIIQKYLALQRDNDSRPKEPMKRQTALPGKKDDIARVMAIAHRMINDAEAFESKDFLNNLSQNRETISQLCDGNGKSNWIQPQAQMSQQNFDPMPKAGQNQLIPPFRLFPNMPLPQDQPSFQPYSAQPGVLQHSFPTEYVFPSLPLQQSSLFGSMLNPPSQISQPGQQHQLPPQLQLGCREQQQQFHQQNLSPNSQLMLGSSYDPSLSYKASQPLPNPVNTPEAQYSFNPRTYGGRDEAFGFESQPYAPVQTFSSPIKSSLANNFDYGTKEEEEEHIQQTQLSETEKKKKKKNKMEESGKSILSTHPTALPLSDSNEYVGGFFDYSKSILLPYMGLKSVKEIRPDCHNQLNDRIPRQIPQSSSSLSSSDWLSNLMLNYPTPDKVKMLERLLEFRLNFEKMFPKLYKTLAEQYRTMNRTKIVIQPPEIPSLLRVPVPPPKKFQNAPETVVSTPEAKSYDVNYVFDYSKKSK